MMAYHSENKESPVTTFDQIFPKFSLGLRFPFSFPFFVLFLLIAFLLVFKWENTDEGREKKNGARG
jgi:hypothetical protein